MKCPMGVEAPIENHLPCLWWRLASINCCIWRADVAPDATISITTVDWRSATKDKTTEQHHWQHVVFNFRMESSFQHLQFAESRSKLRRPPVQPKCTSHSIEIITSDTVILLPLLYLCPKTKNSSINNWWLQHHYLRSQLNQKKASQWLIYEGKPVNGWFMMQRQSMTDLWCKASQSMADLWGKASQWLSYEEKPVNDWFMMQSQSWNKPCVFRRSLARTVLPEPVGPTRRTLWPEAKAKLASIFVRIWMRKEKRRFEFHPHISHVFTWKSLQYRAHNAGPNWEISSSKIYWGCCYCQNSRKFGSLFHYPPTFHKSTVLLHALDTTSMKTKTT